MKNVNIDALRKVLSVVIAEGIKNSKDNAKVIVIKIGGSTIFLEKDDFNDLILFFQSLV
jgi:hypothetical protein